MTIATAGPAGVHPPTVEVGPVGQEVDRGASALTRAAPRFAASPPAWDVWNRRLDPFELNRNCGLEYRARGITLTFRRHDYVRFAQGSRTVVEESAPTVTVEFALGDGGCLEHSPESSGAVQAFDRKGIAKLKALGPALSALLAEAARRGLLGALDLKEARAQLAKIMSMSAEEVAHAKG